MNTELKRAFISFRIAVQQWMPEKRFQALLALFEKYKGVTDEITFFTSETHPPLPLDVIKERVELLAKRMMSVRQMGYRTGINVLATIGHHEENLPNSLSGDYTRMTDMDGNTCLGSFCPNEERVRSYVEKLYRLVAQANPDYIRIDDDVRLAGHRPVGFGCFCDKCLSIFAEECGIKYTRETLKCALNTGSVAEKLKVRKTWLAHNRNTIARLFELIERTVHGVKPGLPLGFMTGDRFFEGYDFDTWAEILSGPGKAEVRWRPGGGFYWDDTLKELAGKSHDVGRQVSVLPQHVVSIQSEIENFPYQRLQKSAHTTALETASHIAAGCTGAAFNVLSFYDEPLGEYEPLVAKLHQARPFFDLLVRELGRTEPKGIYTGWTKDSFVANNIGAGEWCGEEWEKTQWGKIQGSYAYEILEIGVPASYSPAFASVTALSGDNVLALNHEEIIEALSAGVYMDAQALSRLNEMGYGKLTGFGVEGFVEKDATEEFVNHPLNVTFTGRRRDGRQSFWECPAAILTPLNEKSEILARMVDYGGKEITPCCMGVFENQLGGRICVAGYYPWKFVQNLAKSTQIKSLMRWLSRDTLPGYVASFHKINIWIREPQKGGLAAVMTNSCLDAARNVTLMLLTASEEIDVFDMRCTEARIRACGTDGPYRKFILPAIGAWEMVLAVTIK